jgi:O-methyltransferase
MSSLSRAPEHIATLTKNAGLACYRLLLDWAMSHHPDRRFSSAVIHLKDAEKFSRQLNRGYRDEEVLKRITKKISPNTMASYDGVATLIDQARYCEERRIGGAFVELGTWKGGCLGAMALANLTFSTSRRMLHGFDSFQGLPMPRADKDDMQWATNTFRLDESECDGSLRPAKALDEASPSDVERLLSEIGYSAAHFRLHRGWFQDTIPAEAGAIPEIAILRIDGDLYDSYLVALSHLWDKVVPGGFVIFDDWALKGCRDAVNDFFDRRSMRPYLCHVDYSVRYLQKAL